MQTNLSTATTSNYIEARAQARLDEYTAAYPSKVRDLAEMVALATGSGEAFAPLTDAEDERAIVFRECVALYAKRYRIDLACVTAAVGQWNAMA